LNFIESASGAAAEAPFEAAGIAVVVSKECGSAGVFLARSITRARARVKASDVAFGFADLAIPRDEERAGEIPAGPLTRRA